MFRSPPLSSHGYAISKQSRILASVIRSFASYYTHVVTIRTRIANRSIPSLVSRFSCMLIEPCPLISSPLTADDGFVVQSNPPIFLPSFLSFFLFLTIRGNGGSFSRQQRAPSRVFNNRNYPGNRNSGEGDAPRWFHPVSAERNWSACR